jgi:hypothetical protein
MKEIFLSAEDEHQLEALLETLAEQREAVVKCPVGSIARVMAWQNILATMSVIERIIPLRTR